MVNKNEQKMKKHLASYLFSSIIDFRAFYM